MSLYSADYYSTFFKKYDSFLKKAQEELEKQLRNNVAKYVLRLQGFSMMHLNSGRLEMQVCFIDKAIVKYGLEVIFSFKPNNDDGEVLEYVFKIKTQNQVTMIHEHISKHRSGNQLTIFNHFFNYEYNRNKKIQEQRIFQMNRIVNKIKLLSIFK